MAQEPKRNSVGEVLSRCAVMLPEISPDAHLHLNIEALEALETQYGDDYVSVVFERLEAMTLSVVKTVAGHAVRVCTVDQLLSELTPSEASKRLVDALSLIIYGRTAEEEMEKRQADTIARMKKMRAAEEGAAR